MRSALWNHFGHPRFGASPVLVGIAAALAELYEPLIREALPNHWARLVATLDADIPPR